MKRWGRKEKAGWASSALALILAIGAAHVVAIALIPRAIMAVAMDRTAEAAGGWNRWAHSPRVTAQTQQIVRASPDLAYSACAVEVGYEPVRVRVAPWGDYVSVAVYDAATNNVFTLNDRQMGAAGARLMIVGMRTPLIAQEGETVVSLPSSRGLVLVRRLAPTPAAFARADAARTRDVCAQVVMPALH